MSHNRISDFSVLHLQVSSYLLVMVTPFLAIRSAANVAFAVLYTYLGHEQQNSNGVISAGLLGITSVVLYAGLVFMGFCKDWSREDAPVLYSQHSYGSATASQQYNSQVKQPFASTIRVK
jgi:hypothetical protein